MGMASPLRLVGGPIVLALAILAVPADARDARPQTIPALRSWQPATGTWRLRQDARIVVRPAGRPFLLAEARQLAADMRRLLGRPVAVSSQPEARIRPGDLTISRLRREVRLEAEGYRLRIGEALEIAAKTRAGAFYGGRTLLQLLRQGSRVPRGSAVDWPRYPERGLMIDLGRRIYAPAWIKREIRQLAELKLNLFHWHLTDDQRWGIESDRHPEIVSERHLTKAQVREILAIARRYHVTIVPEIDMPGHMGSLLAAHPELELEPATPAATASPERRRLDITDPAALRIVRSLLDEYLPLFPGPYWHVGADEYLSRSEFARYPQLEVHARRRYGPEARTEDAILGFVNWVDRIVRGRGKTLRAWHDQLRDGGALLDGGHRIVNAGWFPTYYTADVGPVEGRPEMRKAYEEWGVHQFAGPTIGGQLIEPPYLIAPGQRRNLGAKVNAWENIDLTLGEIAAGLEPRLAVIAEKTWGSPPQARSYGEFERLMAALGLRP